MTRLLPILVFAEVMLLALLVSCTSSTHTAEFNKTVQQGETVREPVLKVNKLQKDDHLIMRHGDTLYADYFCNKWKCHNDATSVGQFQEYLEDLYFVIQNVNVSDSGEYIIVRNRVENLLKMTLNVEVLPISTTPFPADEISTSIVTQKDSTQNTNNTKSHTEDSVRSPNVFTAVVIIIAGVAVFASFKHRAQIYDFLRRPFRTPAPQQQPDDVEMQNLQEGSGEE